MSRDRKIDFGEGQSWTAHRQEHWREWAGNPNFPDYQRIVFVAYARHTANGHAKLGKGELARYLIRKDGTLPERRTIWHAINKAIELGYLLPESRLLCLVVSSDHVQGGRGKPDQPCPRDHTSRKQNVVSGQRRWVPNVVSGAGRSDPNVVSGERRSTLTPSISLVTASPDAGTTDQGEAIA